MGLRGVSRVRRVVAVGVVAVAAATTAGALVHLHRIAAMIPPADASSEEVLRVYLAAAKDHDCGVTKALTVSEGGERALAWCGGRTQTLFTTHPDLISYTNIGAATVGPVFGSRNAAERCYPVDITETNMNGAEPGALPGWQFCLAETPNGWRLADEGYG